MKSYNGLFDNMLSESAMDDAFRKAARGKRKREDVQYVLGDLEKHKKKLTKLLVKDRFKLKKHETCKINEYNCHKERNIVKPYFRYEQVVHHLVVAQLKPVVMDGLYEFSCGSIPERGCHYGKRHIEKWIAQYGDKPIYVLKMDIRHFFENIDHDILKGKLDGIIRDKRFLKLCYMIIDNHEVGIPLGYYTSQWFANLYFKKFDHYVKEVLHADHYIRYMDDMNIFDTSKERLHWIRENISEYLEKELRLELKGNWQVFPLAVDSKDVHGRPLDFMGFKFYRNATTLRKSILRRVRRKSRRIARKSKVTWYDAVSMISYIGWITHTATYNYYLSQVKPNIDIKSLKLKVSRHDRRENRKHDELANSEGDARVPSLGGGQIH